MAVKPVKNPRYKHIPGKLARWQDTVTGEILTRTQFEKATAAAANNSNAASSTVLQRKTFVTKGNYKEAATPVVTSSSAQEPVPLVETPEPPPLVQAYSAAHEAAEIAHAAASSMDRLATRIGDGLAKAAAFASEAFLPERLSYWAIPEDSLAEVTKPACRLIARHSPIDVNLGPDTEDVADLFTGLIGCVVAVSAQKMLYEREKERTLLQHIHDFEVKNGPGSYQKALAAARGQAAPSGENVAQGQATQGHENGAGGSAANGAGLRQSYQGRGSGQPTITDELLASHGRSNGSH